MLVQVLKPFSYSADGRSTVMVHPGPEPVEIRDELCAGLSGDGYIDGAPHGLPLLSEGRRKVLIDAMLEAGRAELAKLSDQDLIDAAAHYRAKADEAPAGAPVEPAHETKVIEAAPETGEPEPIATEAAPEVPPVAEVADEAPAETDDEAAPGKSKAKAKAADAAE